MTKSKVRIDFPHSFKKISLKEDAKEIIKEEDGKLALIVDEHYTLEGHLNLVRIVYDPNDKECYYVQRLDGGKFLSDKIRLHYNDLKELYIKGNLDFNSFYIDFKEENEP